MSDVLDQSEIDALLSAVDTGEVEQDDSTLQIFSRHRKDLETVEVRPYDFKRPERVSKDQMRSLHTLHESFARNFGGFHRRFSRHCVPCFLPIRHAPLPPHSRAFSRRFNPRAPGSPR